jgi:hypothetical protein
MDDYIYLIDIDADYQREKVWSKSEQEDLLDSIARDIDIPKLYLARVPNNEQFDYECIDGKQRLITIASFVRPEPKDKSPLNVEILNKRYSFEMLEKELPSIAQAFLDYRLDFVIYAESVLTETFIRDIFRKLQLGVRLNSGEILNAQIGTIRDFVFKVFKENGRECPFLRKTKLSDKRYSRQFTLAQICINSFYRSDTGQFVRARLPDLEEFFADKSSIARDDKNLIRIRQVLRKLDASFSDNAAHISSRAVAVSAYLFVEGLLESRRLKLTRQFSKFYVALLQVIKADMDLISKYKQPRNSTVLDQFQKYVLQASVEPYSIKRRDDFLKKAFDYYRSPKTKGKIIGS